MYEFAERSAEHCPLTIPAVLPFSWIYCPCIWCKRQLMHIKLNACRVLQANKPICLWQTYNLLNFPSQQHRVVLKFWSLKAWEWVWNVTSAVTSSWKLRILICQSKLQIIQPTLYMYFPLFQSSAVLSACRAWTANWLRRATSTLCPWFQSLFFYSSLI